MKSYFFTILIAALSLVGVPGRTESAVGNGGHGVLCTETDGRKSVELLDLFEAVNEWHLTLDESGVDQSLEEILLKRFGDLAPDLLGIAGGDQDRFKGKLSENVLKSRFATIQRAADFLKGKIKLREVGDTKHRITRGDGAQCAIVAIANFTEDGRLLIVDEYYQMLSPLHQAALWAHEMIYEVSRRSFANLEDSNFTRRIVGKIFSTERAKYKPMRSFIEDGHYEALYGKNWIKTSCWVVRESYENYEEALKALNIIKSNAPKWVSEFKIESWSPVDPQTQNILKTYVVVDYTPKSLRPESRDSYYPGLIYYGRLSRVEILMEHDMLLPSKLISLPRKEWFWQDYPVVPLDLRDPVYFEVKDALPEVAPFKIRRERETDFVEVIFKDPSSFDDTQYSLPLQCLSTRSRYSETNKRIVEVFDNKAQKWKQ